MLKLSVLTAAPALALVSAPAIAAGPNATEMHETVPHEDLDLTTETGVAVLDERIKTIIRRHCANGGRDSASIRLERDCRASAYAAAEDQVRFAINAARDTKVRLASATPVKPEA